MNIKWKNTSFILLVGLMLSSCQNPSKVYQYEDYVSNLTYVDQFLICQLGDLHLSKASFLDDDFAYIEKTIKSYSVVKNVPYEMAKPNILIFNGDTFMNADKNVVIKTLDFIDSLDIPYAFTWGNHDLQGSYYPEFILDELSKRPNSLLKNPKDDNVYGNCNYVVNLFHMDELMFQLYFLDSNSFVFAGYDTFHQDQIDWYEKMVIESQRLSSNPTKSLAFFHIPTIEFETAINQFGAKMGEVKKDEYNYCYINESISYPNKNSGLVDKMFELNSTVGIGVNHDHINSTDLWYYGQYDHPIRLIYGNKATRNIYYDDDMLGAAFYTLNEKVNALDEKTNKKSYFKLTKVLVPYDEEKEVSIEWER